MAGSGLVAIKHRMKSVKNISKITKAMNLVSTSKLRKTRNAKETNSRYTEELEECFKSLISNYTDDSVYFNSNSTKKLFIVYTSDTGLCGGFNGSVINFLMSEIKKEEDVDIAVIGQKGKVYLAKYKRSSVKEFLNMPDIPTVEEISKIRDFIMDSYLNGIYGEVNVIYTNFISAVKSSVVKEKLLPLSVERGAESNGMIFEPDVEILFQRVVNLYVNQKLLTYALNAKCSEQSSRMSAMDAATKNGEELLGKLNLKYNRARQSMITQEISEIVGGAEAQK